MCITWKERVSEPFVSPGGERILELIGRPDRLGGSTEHSIIADVVLPSRGSASMHYHRDAGQTHHIIRGRGTLRVDDGQCTVGPGDTILMSPSERHMMLDEGVSDLDTWPSARRRGGPRAT